MWGYLCAAEEQLFAGMRETIYQRSLPAATRSLQLERARLGDDAGVSGAAMMVIEHILSDQAIDESLASAGSGPRSMRDAP